MTSTSQSSADPVPSDSLANRYGRPQSAGPYFLRGRGRWVAVIALVLAVAVTFWFAASSHSRTLDWKDVGFTIDSPTQASVTFQLTKEPQDTVQCAVQVLSPEFAVVGWRTVTIGPEAPSEDSLPSDRTVMYDVDLRTDALGTNGGVNDCWFPEDG
ncbi:DUF4307 domain-containing protein [Citricoccus nitrophenolicus]|uniref:DUF4307 domain-containing protein n=1 Tax=Citricoccus nitrophenolicus TaxID=863575 RepID=A0ABV0IK01_9MICC|nr:DUF4307 domain-containing protein [Citricoccus sp. I39-566]WMY79597.1 DUF4307 domain-containing protein [Citricoccus sp. I39-566]